MSCVVHIGHGKTGTSTIQSYLAGAVDGLKMLGIQYPQHPSFDFAAKGSISSGNGAFLLEEDHDIKPNSLYSNESLYRQLASDDALKRLLTNTDGKFKVICYTRDLFDYSFSEWGQRIKRSNLTLEYNEYMRIFFTHANYFEGLEYWINASIRLGFELNIFNYSRHKHEIILHFLENTIDNKTEDLLSIYPIENRIINRSLTLSEYEFQRLMNKNVASVSHRNISDALVTQLPNITAQTPFIEQDTYQFVIKKLTPMIARINTSLPSSEIIRIQDFKELNSISQSQNSQSYEFSKEQLEVLTNAFARLISNPVAQHTTLNTGGHASKLRDIALKFDRKCHLNLDDAIYLMSLAKKENPKGPFILEKLAEYKSKLAKNSDQ